MRYPRINHRTNVLYNHEIRYISRVPHEDRHSSNSSREVVNSTRTLRIFPRFEGFPLTMIGLLTIIDENGALTKTKEEHEMHLGLNLELSKREKLYAKFSKCEFWLQEVQFIGDVINAKPLTILTQKHKEYVWGEKQERAFQILKDKLCNAPILALPDGQEDFVVYCDASDLGLGCVLMQRGRKLSEALKVEIVGIYEVCVERQTQLVRGLEAKGMSYNDLLEHVMVAKPKKKQDVEAKVVWQNQKTDEVAKILQDKIFKSKVDANAVNERVSVTNTLDVYFSATNFCGGLG
ncbi:putative reverse transcriptase domain-containing protein [Tanacetum coccineum]